LKYRRQICLDIVHPDFQIVEEIFIPSYNFGFNPELKFFDATQPRTGPAIKHKWPAEIRIYSKGRKRS
jgi:hypothetical protein